MKKILTRHKSKGLMKTYVFDVVIEPDEDGWFAYCPVLESRGAATWGQTKEEAARKIQEVLELVVEGMIEDGEELPIQPEKAETKTSFNPLVTYSTFITNYICFSGRRRD